MPTETQLSLKERAAQLYYRRAPVAALPPHGSEWRRFERFLRNMPEGGLGFHSTGSQYLPAIREQGLDPAKFRGSRREEVHYYFLDPVTDPYIVEVPGIDGQVITYHRWRNTLDAQFTYGRGQTYYRDRNGNPAPYSTERNQHPALVVFEQATPLAFKDDIAETTEPKLLTEIEGRYGYVSLIDQGLRTRNFIIPQQVSVDSTQLEKLPWGQAHQIPKDVVVATYVYDPAQSVREYTVSIMQDLMNRYK